MNKALTAQDFIDEILTNSNSKDRETMMYFFKTGKGQYGENDQFAGVKFSKVNEMSRKYVQLPIEEIEKLLTHPLHEVRGGAIYIMNRLCKLSRTSQEVRKSFYDLYLKNHAHINNWDLVDSGSIHIIGGYLMDKQRDILYELVKSENMWERRTAMVSTYYFIRNNDLEDTFRLVDILINDKKDLIHKATGWMLRCAGQKNKARLIEYLEKRAAHLPRTALRYAIEKFEKSEKDYFMQLR